MSSVDTAVATFERNIEMQTGQSVASWVETVGRCGQARHGAIVTWLKAEYGLSHAHANHIAKRALEAAAPRSIEDPVAHLFEGAKGEMRPVYEQLARAATELGPDVELAPKKANVSLRRRKQFALIQPSTRTRVDLGLILPGRQSAGRLEPSGTFNAMFTHRVKLSSVNDIDAEVIAWLKEAYEAAK